MEVRTRKILFSGNQHPGTGMIYKEQDLFKFYSINSSVHYFLFQRIHIFIRARNADQYNRVIVIINVNLVKNILKESYIYNLFILKKEKYFLKYILILSDFNINFKLHLI